MSALGFTTSLSVQSSAWQAHCTSKGPVTCRSDGQPAPPDGVQPPGQGIVSDDAVASNETISIADQPEAPCWTNTQTLWPVRSS
jgi:hypothetical protein